ncbi:hypothetical protein R6Q59_007407 [Mikania micrantha]
MIIPRGYPQHLLSNQLLILNLYLCNHYQNHHHLFLPLQSSFEDSSLVASSKAPEVLPIEESKNSLPDEQDFSEDFEHLFMTEPEPTVEYTFDYDYDAVEAASVATPRGKMKFLRSYAKQKSTFDDIPPSKWRDFKSIEMLTWCLAEPQFYDIDMVIKRFLTRFKED